MISLLYAGNAAAFDGILISLSTALRHTSQPMNVYILTMDRRKEDPAFAPIDESMRRYLQSLCRRYYSGSRVFLYDVGGYYESELASSPNDATSYTPYCFLRLFADRIPEIPGKVLYLDADTVVNKDLSALFSIDVRGYEYAAVLDHYGKIFMGRRYINSGVLLLNLEEIRKTGLFVRTVRLCATRRLFLPDQTALHRLTKKKLLLPGVYNEQKRYDREETVIQHFTKTIRWLPVFHTRNVKPWQVDAVKSKLTRRYDDALDDYLRLKREFESKNEGA